MRQNKVMVGLVAGLLCMGASVNAGTWYGGAGDNQWSNSGNWVGGNITDGTGETGIFDTRGPGNIVLSQARSASHVYQSSTANGTNHSFSGSSLSVYGNLSNNSLNDSTMTFNNEVIMTGGVDAIGTRQGGQIVLGGTLTLADHTTFASANSGLEISGNIVAGGKELRVNTSGSWVVTPTDILSLTGSGTWSGGGTLKVYEGIFFSNRTATDSSAVRANSIQLFDGGTFLLGNDEQIGNGLNVSVGQNGSLFDLDGHTETILSLGALSSGLEGAVAMGDGGVLHLATQGSGNLGGLDISEWSTNGNDHIYVDGGSFTSAQLAGIDFAGYGSGAQVLGGELVPMSIPEPAALGLIGMTGVVVLFIRRRLMI